MKVNRIELINALKLVKKAEITFFSAKENFLKIIFQDYEKIIEIKIPVFLEEEFEFAIHRETILNLISKIPDDFIFIKKEEERIKIFFESSNAKGIINDHTLIILSADEINNFTQITSEYAKENLFEIPQNIFSHKINKIIYAVSIESYQTALNNILLSIQENKIDIAATDSRRLSLISHFIENKEGIKKDILIPYELAVIFIKIKSESCIISCYEKGFLFIFDNIKIYLFDIVDSFPNYNRVIPEKFENKIIINKENLIESIKRLSLYSVLENRIILNFKEKNLILSSNNKNIGYGKEEIFFESEFFIDDITIYINYIFFLECLKKIETENIIIKFNSEKTPFYIIPDEDNINHINLIMPMSGE